MNIYVRGKMESYRKAADDWMKSGNRAKFEILRAAQAEWKVVEELLRFKEDAIYHDIGMVPGRKE